MEKILLNINETSEYLNIGKTKTREILRSPTCSFSVQIGNRWYANKKKLDQILEKRLVKL